SMVESGGSLSGTIAPSMRKSGGDPVVMCMSLAPFSIMARKSWCRLTFRPSSGFIACSPSVRHRHAQDLFRSRDAFQHLLDSAGAQGRHTELDRRRFQLGARRALQHALFQIIPEAHDFVQRDAALVAGVVAGGAADALHDVALERELRFAHA